MAEALPGGHLDQLDVTVVVCLAPRTVNEWTGKVPAGADVNVALQASGYALAPSQADSSCVGIWGKACKPTTPLVSGDRVEVYRALKVDPKVARRERFAQQGARTAGLFALDRKT